MLRYNGELGLGWICVRLVVAALFGRAVICVLAAATSAKPGCWCRRSIAAARPWQVILDGEHAYTWQVSTGRPGLGTPAGIFHPQWMAARWFSHIYYNAPMPHAIFFYGGFAIHGTYDIARLGGPASHGCIRLHPNDAAVLFELVQREGMRNTTIVVQ